MNTENIDENQGVQLSTKLDFNKIRGDFEGILEFTRKNIYTLPKKYALVKRLQRAICESFTENDIDKIVPLFTIVETIRKNLGHEYEARRETNIQIRNIQAIVRQYSLLVPLPVNNVVNQLCNTTPALEFPPSFR